MESLKQICEVIQALIIQKNFDELTHTQNESVESHLKTCRTCQNFQKVLLKMNELTDYKEEKAVSLPVTTYQNLRQRVAAKKKSNISIFQQSWEWLKNILDYRVPVYQIVFGGVMILMIFFISRQVSYEDKYEIPVSPSISTLETPVVETMQVLNPHEVLEKQMIGQSVKEDTALYRFLVTVM
jgi:predicted anti-sigma-YlaC factor YlaD